MAKKNAGKEYTYSVYDLNMAQTLKVDLPYALANEKVTNPQFDPEHFRSQSWKLVETYCRDKGLDYDYLQKASPAVPIIIDSSHYLYFAFLNIALTFYDPFLIKYFLAYQYNNFKGNHDAENRLAFLGRLVFNGYPYIRQLSPNANLHRKEKIFDWLETHNIENLPERFSMQSSPLIDERLKGKLTPEEILKYWMQLCSFSKKGNRVEALNEIDIKQFLQSSFAGFTPIKPIRKLVVKNITPTEFRRFCNEFFVAFRDDNRTSEFIFILKRNFAIFDSTTFENLKKNFSK